MAFGLTVVTMAYAFGRVSGAHFNPAVTIGLAAAGRFPGGRVVPYIISQCLGAILAAFVLFLIAVCTADTMDVGSFAANGYGALSPDKYSVTSAFLCEAVLTFGFLLVIIGSTDSRAPSGFAPLAIRREASFTNNSRVFSCSARVTKRFSNRCPEAFVYIPHSAPGIFRTKGGHCSH